MSNLIGDIALTIFLSCYYILPAYVANGCAVFTGGGKPIDQGRNFRDGRRILGEGKTIRGFFGGWAIGFFAGIFQIFFYPIISPVFQSIFAQYDISIELQLAAENVFYCPLVRAIIMPLAALIGDLIGSFIKRRLGLERGRPAPLLDQLDFLLVAFFISYLVTPVPISFIITLVILTPVIHLISNTVAYLLKLKKEPW
ncbi:MAG: CDP-2,3-bis-(O-geranylgeranyl)-sn-glycerol synthase [Candidatus Odinarchaeia archaeon]